jgi:hypothetical protein
MIPGIFFIPDVPLSISGPHPLRVCWMVIFFLLMMENLRSPPEGGPLSCLRETQDNNSAQNLERTTLCASP